MVWYCMLSYMKEWGTMHLYDSSNRSIKQSLKCKTMCHKRNK